MDKYEAKIHYQNVDTAKRYKHQFSGPVSLSNLRSKIVGWGETRAFLKMLEKIMGAKTALDVACGTGRYLEILLDYGYHVGGIDVSNEMLSFARQHVGDKENLLFIQQGDAENLPFENDQFDLVTCMRLYHRVPADIRKTMLHEVQRVGNGHAILFFGISTRLLRLRRYLRTKIIQGRPSNPYPLTQSQLLNELKLLGMKIQDTAWVLPLLAEGLVVRVTW
jgi:SAM-dependent methyltransferase